MCHGKTGVNKYISLLPIHFYIIKQFHMRCQSYLLIPHVIYISRVLTNCVTSCSLKSSITNTSECKINTIKFHYPQFFKSFWFPLAVIMKRVVFWIVKPRRSERACYFKETSPPSSGLECRQNKNPEEAGGKVSCLAYSLKLKMEVMFLWNAGLRPNYVAL
jgi:hypothetical protein